MRAEKEERKIEEEEEEQFRRLGRQREEDKRPSQGAVVGAGRGGIGGGDNWRGSGGSFGGGSSSSVVSERSLVSVSLAGANIPHPSCPSTGRHSSSWRGGRSFSSSRRRRFGSRSSSSAFSSASSFSMWSYSDTTSFSSVGWSSVTSAASRRLTFESAQPVAVVFVLALAIGAVVSAQYALVDAGSGNTMSEVRMIAASIDHRQTYPDGVGGSHHPRPEASDLRRGSLRSRGGYVREKDGLIVVEDEGRVRVGTIRGESGLGGRGGGGSGTSNDNNGGGSEDRKRAVQYASTRGGGKHGADGRVNAIDPDLATALDKGRHLQNKHPDDNDTGRGNRDEEIRMAEEIRSIRLKLEREEKEKSAEEYHRLRERAKAIRAFEDQDRDGDSVRSRAKSRYDDGGGSGDTKVRTTSLADRDQEREEQRRTLRQLGSRQEGDSKESP